MFALKRAARLGSTVLVEVAMVAALVALGRRSELAVPVGHLGTWLRDGDPATVVVAVARWIALVGAGWLLGSTLLYLAASLSRVPAAMRAVGWTTLPSVRRAVDAVGAASVATAVVLAPSVAGAARASDPPSVSLVRDGHSGGDGGDGGGIGRLPADPTPTSLPTPPSSSPPSPPPPTTAVVAPVPAPAAAEPEPDADPEVVVAAGDNLWLLAARHLAAVSGRSVGDVPEHEVAPYWVRVCDANRERLASGDPNLIFPGERVVLPPV
jgi:hypothetical protein